MRNGNTLMWKLKMKTTKTRKAKMKIPWKTAWGRCHHLEESRFKPCPCLVQLSSMVESPWYSRERQAPQLCHHHHPSIQIPRLNGTTRSSIQSESFPEYQQTFSIQRKKSNCSALKNSWTTMLMNSRLSTMKNGKKKKSLKTTTLPSNPMTMKATIRKRKTRKPKNHGVMTNQRLKFSRKNHLRHRPMKTKHPSLGPSPLLWITFWVNEVSTRMISVSATTTQVVFWMI
mmetsp:Transcript_42146/g.101687  ORF Transcript_42146/g.101687 Transcript_42146/m.101687 type:complete len:229 (+) Transcript_42146:2295-2981(+)